MPIPRKISSTGLLALMLVSVPAIGSAQTDPADRELELARAAALADSAGAAFRQGRNEVVREVMPRVLAIGRRYGDTPTINRALFGLSVAALRDQDFDEIGRRAAQLIELGDSADYSMASYNGYHVLAEAARLQGRNEEAEAYYAYTLGLVGLLGNTSLVGVETYNLGMIRLRGGDTELARRMFELSERASWETDDEAGLAYVVFGLAASAVEEGSFERAATLFGATDAAFESMGIRLDPSDRQDYERYRARTASGLSPEGAASARERGRAMSVEEALALGFS